MRELGDLPIANERLSERARRGVCCCRLAKAVFVAQRNVDCALEQNATTAQSQGRGAMQRCTNVMCLGNVVLRAGAGASRALQFIWRGASPPSLPQSETSVCPASKCRTRSRSLPPHPSLRQKNTVAGLAIARPSAATPLHTPFSPRLLGARRSPPSPQLPLGAESAHRARARPGLETVILLVDRAAQRPGSDAW